LEFTPEQIMGGLVGIGLVAKGIMDHLSSKRAVPMCACKYTGEKHDKVLLEFERVNMKLDNIEERCCD
jgi:hypothetical protein